MRMTLWAVVPVLMLTAVGFSQETTTQPADGSTSSPPSKSSAGWASWPGLTGDWGGLRSSLADEGINVKLDVTNVLQHNAHGGADTNNGLRYSGSGDLTVILDTQKLGLWNGGTIVLNGEPKWGNGANRKVGSLVPVNYDSYKPSPDDSCVMTFSEWFLWQDFFDKKVSFFGGKLDPARVFDKNAFANDERTQFLNAGLRNNVQLVPFAGYTSLGGGIQLAPTDWLTIATAIVDSDGSATRTGFDTLFHGPADHISLAHEWDFKIKPFGQPGTQRVGFVWSGEDTTHLAPALIRLLGLNTVSKVAPFLPHESSGHNLMAYYNFDQYLYHEQEDPTQGFGLFGRFGWASPEVNAIAHFYDIGVGGKGVISGRDNDTFGLGYYYLDLSERLPSIFHSEQGIEAFYNIEVTKWLHISPDVQFIIDPGGNGANQNSIVYGVRAQISL